MLRRGLFLAAAAALTALSTGTAAIAVPASIGAALATDDGAIQKVQFWPGYEFSSSPLDLPAAVIGGTVGLVAGALNATTYGPYPGGPYFGPSYADRMAACAANFQSFDPVSGTYTTYEGFQVLCPFLR